MSSSVMPAETSAPATSPPPTAKPSSALASAASRPERAAIGRAAEDEIAVVIGEAEGGAVAPDEPPAMAERRRAVGQMGGEVRGDGAHEGNLECDAEGPNLNTVIPAQAGIHNHDACRKKRRCDRVSASVSGYGSRAPLTRPRDDSEGVIPGRSAAKGKGIHSAERVRGSPSRPAAAGDDMAVSKERSRSAGSAGSPPASKAERSMSSSSVSKRTGTSKAKPAVIDGAGQAVRRRRSRGRSRDRR